MSALDFDHLLRSYRFLATAEERHGEAMTTADRAGVQRDLGEAFATLLTKASGDSEVAAVQLLALVECLAGTSRDAELADYIVAACRSRIADVAANRKMQAASAATGAAAFLAINSGLNAERLSVAEINAMNALPDRVAIVDKEFRYIFTNYANAHFHATKPGAFVGEPIWTKLTDQYFADVTKPAFEACFAGRELSFVSPHPGRDPSQYYACKWMPLRDQEGRVNSVLGVASEIHGLYI